MIKELVCLIIGFCILSNVAINADILEGGVQQNWTINKARTEAFKNIPYIKDLSWAPAVDPYYIENMEAKKNNIRQIKNRIITFFSTGNYAIHEKGSVNTFYFQGDGTLHSVEYDTPKPYPCKNYKYRYPNGELFTVTLDVSNNECFIFKPAGQLAYHWVNNKCYTETGKLFMTRFSVDY